MRGCSRSPEPGTVRHAWASDRKGGVVTPRSNKTQRLFCIMALPLNKIWVLYGRGWVTWFGSSLVWLGRPPAFAPFRWLRLGWFGFVCCRGAGCGGLRGCSRFYGCRGFVSDDGRPQNAPLALFRLHRVGGAFMEAGFSKGEKGGVSQQRAPRLSRHFFAA